VPARGRKNAPSFSDSYKAVRAIGTNAFPTLLGMLAAHDSPLKLKLVGLAQKQHVVAIHFIPADILYLEAQNGFTTLGPVARLALPDLIRIYDRNVSQGSQANINYIFYSLGKDAKAAVPSLARSLTNQDYYARKGAISALGHIRTDPELVVPALIAELHDPFAPNRADAAYALGAYRTNALQAVGPLIELLNDPNRTNNPSGGYANISAAVKFALEKIDPAAAVRAGVK
jgi:hypothetical protein